MFNCCGSNNLNNSSNCIGLSNQKNPFTNAFNNTNTTNVLNNDDECSCGSDSNNNACGCSNDNNRVRSNDNVCGCNNHSSCNCCDNNTNCSKLRDWCSLLAPYIGRQCCLEFIICGNLVKRNGILCNVGANFVALLSSNNSNSCLICDISDLVFAKVC